MELPRASLTRTLSADGRTSRLKGFGLIALTAAFPTVQPPKRCVGDDAVRLEEETHTLVQLRPSENLEQIGGLAISFVDKKVGR